MKTLMICAQFLFYSCEEMNLYDFKEQQTSIPEIKNWRNLGYGVDWSGVDPKTVTLINFNNSDHLGVEINNPFIGIYNFTLSLTKSGETVDTRLSVILLDSSLRIIGGGEYTTKIDKAQTYNLTVSLAPIQRPHYIAIKVWNVGSGTANITFSDFDLN